MMEQKILPANLRLSDDEMKLVLNSDWILTKRKIINKAEAILQQQIIDFKECMVQYPSAFSKEVLSVPPKVSRGENYLGLPYLVLDYPRFFQKQDACAIRCMFWWGNFFSISLHLQGMYKAQYLAKIINSYGPLSENDFYLSTASTPFEFHFKKNTTTSIQMIEKKRWKEYLRKNDFLKIAAKTELDNWYQITHWLKTNYCILLKCLSA